MINWPWKWRTADELIQIEKYEEQAYFSLRELLSQLVQLEIELKKDQKMHKQCHNQLNIAFSRARQAMESTRRACKLTLKEEKLEGERKDHVRDAVALLQKRQLEAKMQGFDFNKELEFLENELGLK